MDAATLNRKLAEALGWKWIESVRSWRLSFLLELAEKDFTPATSSDILRLYVLPEIERRGLWAKWFKLITKGVPDDIRNRVERIAHQAAKELMHTSDFEAGLSCVLSSAALFLSPPAVLAAAAIKVLEGEK